MDIERAVRLPWILAAELFERGGGIEICPSTKEVEVAVRCINSTTEDTDDAMVRGILNGVVFGFPSAGGKKFRSSSMLIEPLSGGGRENIEVVLQTREERSDLKEFKELTQKFLDSLPKCGKCGQRRWALRFNYMRDHIVVTCKDCLGAVPICDIHEAP